MDHKFAIQEQLVERYLLNELSESERDQFEEHYFDCLDCAEEVRQGAHFTAGARHVLREQPAAPGGVEPRRSWRDWVWNPLPAYALAAALAITVTVQQAKQPARLEPQFLSGVELRPATRGAPQVIRIAPGQRTLEVAVGVPSGAAYTCTLVNESGTIGNPIQTPVLEAPEIRLLLPADEFRNGKFRLVVRALSSAGAPFQEEFEFITQP